MIADELNKLKQTKAAIKLALIDKGLNPTDEFASYVGNIGSISTGEDPFLALGYPMPDILLTYIDRGLEFKENWNPDNTTLNGGSFPLYLPTGLDCSKVKSLSNNMYFLSFPNIDLPSYNSSSFALYGAEFIELQSLGNNTLTSFKFGPSGGAPSRLKYIKFNKPINLKLTSTSYSNGIFTGCNELEEIVGIENLNTTECTSFAGMFMRTDSYKGTLDLKALNTSNNTTLYYTFSYCGASVIDISTWDVSKITDINYTFLNTSNLDNLMLPDGFGKGVTAAKSLFYQSGTHSYTDFSKIDTSSMTTLANMFCESKIKNIDISSWDISNVTEMRSMFDECVDVETIIFPSKAPLEAVNPLQMLYRCDSLKYIKFPDNFILGSPVSSVISQRPPDYKYKLVAIDGSISVKYNGGDLSWVRISSWSANDPVKSLRKLTIRDLGYSESITSVSLTYTLPNWGVEDPDNPYTQGARQSLIDTLITYSFDRASAGYAACSISLTNSNAQLTEDEIAQITAKGFTIA